MSLLSAVRAGVAVADKVTRPLQSKVSYRRWIGQDGNGDATFAAAVELRAVVDWTSRRVRTITGLDTVSRAVITFLDVEALSAATGGAGISENDSLMMQDGSTGPVLDISGFVSPETGNPIATEVVLG